MDNIQETEFVLARALNAMFNNPNSQEDLDSRKDYILHTKNMKPRVREKLEKLQYSDAENSN